VRKKKEVSSGSSSGGGGGLPPGLTITKESVSILETNETQVTITWLTNYFSTSQIIYSAENEPHILDLDAPNFGYAHSSPEDLNKVTFHSVILTGLASGTTYYYRTVSHASPASISQGYSFTTRSPEVSSPRANDQKLESRNQKLEIEQFANELNDEKNEISKLPQVVAGEQTQKLLEQDVIEELEQVVPKKNNQQENKNYYWLGLTLMLVIILIYFKFRK